MNTDTAVNRIDADTRSRMKQFARGEMTWAEVEGMTYEQANAIATVGCELAAKGRLQEARIIFEGLVAGNPKDSSATSCLGGVYQKLGRKQDALDCYTRAIELLPENVVALAARGELRLRGNDRKGIEDLAMAAKLDEKGVTAGGRRARALIVAMVQHAAQVNKAKARR